MGFDCGSSSHQKQSVQCRLFRNVVVPLQPAGLGLDDAKIQIKSDISLDFLLFLQKNIYLYRVDMKIVPFEWHNLFITVFFLYIRSFQLALALQRQKVEAKVFDNLANHIHLDVAGISLVVEQ